MPDAVLTINAGSSSLKFGLFEARDGTPALLSSGEVEGIEGKPHLKVSDAADKTLDERRWDGGQTREALLAAVLDWVDGHLGDEALRAVGHRVVHGGAKHTAPALVTEALLRELDGLTALAPLHQPHNLSPIRAVAQARPGLKQVACFDTAFHATMPPVATRFALPRRWEAEGVRRYGFHGLSYEWIAGRLRELAPELAGGRVIVAHLGNGASLCAMRDGRSVDTTMSFTALDGLVMGTRPGTLDPGVPLYLLQQHGMSAEALERLLYHESGLLGVSGRSADMRELLAADDPSSQDAVELFVYRIAREAGALVSVLGGLDGFVFTAGIGEHAAEVRTLVCERLDWLGAMLDADANRAGKLSIAAPGSRVALWVIPTDEQATIARHTLALLQAA